jgi:5-methylcytosine-specific restriction endonuclease McrA
MDKYRTQKHYCKCGNKIASLTALYGLGRCRKCFGKYLSKIKKGKKRPVWVKKILQKAMKGRIPWNKGKTCPQTSRSKNGSWKGGITKLNISIRNSNVYSLWRTKIFERDNYTCQNCGAKCKRGKPVILNAHHIYTFSNLLNDYKIKTLSQAFSCKQLWELSIAKTLCIRCHNKTKGRRK